MFGLDSNHHDLIDQFHENSIFCRVIIIIMIIIIIHIHVLHVPLCTVYVYTVCPKYELAIFGGRYYIMSHEFIHEYAYVYIHINCACIQLGIKLFTCVYVHMYVLYTLASISPMYTCIVSATMIVFHFFLWWYKDTVPVHVLPSPYPLPFLG